MKNIYLIGMMGSGKTTTGRELARLLSISFVDLDDQIVDRVGKSINEIFKKEGEPFFRNIESQILSEVAQDSNQVIATGGGIVLSASNCEQMKNTGTAIYLKTGLDVLWQRVKDKKDRPLLQGPAPEKAFELLFYKRIPLYQACANKTFLTDGKTSEVVAHEIYKTCFEK